MVAVEDSQLKFSLCFVRLSVIMLLKKKNFSDFLHIISLFSMLGQMNIGAGSLNHFSGAPDRGDPEVVRRWAEGEPQKFIYHYEGYMKIKL